VVDAKAVLELDDPADRLAAADVRLILAGGRVLPDVERECSAWTAMTRMPGAGSIVPPLSIRGSSLDGSTPSVSNDWLRRPA
jgi:hypothetical protein